MALVFSVTAAALSVYLLLAFDRHDAGYQFGGEPVVVADFGISWHVIGVDGISLFPWWC